jgi:ribokinase
MITVFGSINIDVSVAAARMPRPGETVLGGDAMLSPGGKGANQAHAARRAGAQVQFFGAVGGDAFATPALASLRSAGVDTRGVAVAESHATGLALIMLDAQGENAIVVAPGANLLAHAGQVPDQALAASKVLLLQLETEVATTMALARRARQQGCSVVLNASPLDQAGMIDLTATDILIVNRDELLQLARRFGVDGTEPDAIAEKFSALQGVHVVVTLGAAGAIMALADGSVLAVPALPVQVVDTTGAGDTFAGVLAAAIADGQEYPAALRRAIAAAGLACTRRGAQNAQPLTAEIEQALTA